MNEQLMGYMKKPVLYQEGTSTIWEDEHISKGMLECFLDPEANAPSFKHSFIDKSVDWIASIAPPEKYRDLIDLGCGVGLYAERLCKKGYKVSGIDFAERSVNYAKENAKKNNLDINYSVKNYMDFSSNEEFDVITLISCDFGVLTENNRKLLLEKIFSSLKQGGVFIVDVFTTEYQHKKNPEAKSWEYHDSCFMCGSPHICVKTINYKYDDCNTFCDQYLIIKENSIDCYNVWEHVFTSAEIKKDFTSAGFSTIEFYNHCDGAKYTSDTERICIVAKKGRTRL